MHVRSIWYLSGPKAGYTSVDDRRKEQEKAMYENFVKDINKQFKKTTSGSFQAIFLNTVAVDY